MPEEGHVHIGAARAGIRFTMFSLLPSHWLGHRLWRVYSVAVAAEQAPCFCISMGYRHSSMGLGATVQTFASGLQARTATRLAQLLDLRPMNP